MTATSSRPGLGAIQRGTLIRLSRAPEGLTALDLSDMSGGHAPDIRRHATDHALNLLRVRGLVMIAEVVTRPHLRGKRPFRWVITEKGRELLARGGL